MSNELEVFTKAELESEFKPKYKEENKIFNNKNAFEYQIYEAIKLKEREVIVSEGKPRKLNANDFFKILEKYLAFTVKGNKQERMLWIYDYDSKKYTNDYHIISYLYNQTIGLIDNRILNKITDGLINSPHQIQTKDIKVPWLATKDCIVNTETNETKEYDIYHFTTSNINVNYSNIQNCPTIDGKNILDIIMDLANNENERYLGLLQVIRQALLKQNLDQSIIFLVGSGGSGKSTFINIISNFIDDRLVCNTTIEDLERDDKVLSLSEAHVLLGDDINDDIYIDKLRNIKTLSGGRPITVSQKYKNSTSFKYKGCLIQAAPKIIKAKDRAGQLARRMKPYVFKNNFRNHPIDNIELETYLNNEDVKQYLLYTILNMEELKNQKSFIGWDQQTVETAEELNNPYHAFMEYLKNNTQLLTLDKIPKTLLVALFNDFDERRNGYEVKTRQFTNDISEYMEENGYIEDKTNKRVRPESVKYFIEHEFDYPDQTGLPIITPHVEKLLETNSPSLIFIKK